MTTLTNNRKEHHTLTQGGLTANVCVCDTPHELAAQGLLVSTGAVTHYLRIAPLALSTKAASRPIPVEAHHIHFRERGGKDTLTNLITLCESCHHCLHEGKITLKVQGVSGHLDQIAQRTMQEKSHLYAMLNQIAPVSTAFGYETATFRKYRQLPKSHLTDALCLATLGTGEFIAP